MSKSTQQSPQIGHRRFGYVKVPMTIFGTVDAIHPGASLMETWRQKGSSMPCEVLCTQYLQVHLYTLRETHSDTQ